MDFSRSFRDYPTPDGHFGPYGGAHLTPELKAAFEEINAAYQSICQSAYFINELRRIRREFQGRPTPVYHCDRLSRKLGNCQIYLKRTRDIFRLPNGTPGRFQSCFSYTPLANRLRLDLYICKSQ